MPLPLNLSVGQIPYGVSVASYLAQIWAWDPGYALSQDPEAYEKQRRDCVISSALDHLQRSVVGHSYHFEPEEDTPDGRSLGQVIEQLTKKQRFLPQAWYNLARATHVGATWALIYPRKKVLRIGADKKPREWTIIEKIRDIDKRRFRLVQNYSALDSVKIELLNQRNGTNNGTNSRLLADAIEKALSFNSTKPGQMGFVDPVLGNFRWEFYRGMGAGGTSGFWWQPIEQAAPLDRWIMHAPDTSEWGGGYGYALADDLMAYFWLKGKFLQWGAQGVERWGQGFLVAKVAAMRKELLAKGYSQASAQAQIVSVMRTWRSENVAAIDADMELQLLDMPATAEASVREWIKYLDDSMVKRILAALQPTGNSTGTGSYSSSKVEEGSTESMIAFLRSPLEECWTQTVVRFLVEHNEENLRELGLWDQGYPRLRLRSKQTREIDKMIAVFQLAKELDIPTKKSDFYEIFEITAPNEEDEDVIEYPDPMDAMAGIGGFGEKKPGEDRLPVGEGKSSVAEAAQSRRERARNRVGSAMETFAANQEQLAEGQRMLFQLVERGGAEKKGDIHVHVPTPIVNVDKLLVAAPIVNFAPEINVPEQPPAVIHFAPEINVPEQAPPVVNVPKQEPPKITVNVPEQKAPVVNVAAPIVNVPKQDPPEVTVIVPAARDKKTTYIRDKDGAIVGSETQHAKE